MNKQFAMLTFISMLLVGPASAQMGYGQMGPGMMGGYGQMGPGMMGGYGQMGPGMMGGYGQMGPGMMGGYGQMGPGMMGGYGQMGPGMMGYGWGTGLQLSDKQREQMSKIQDEIAKKHWDLMGKMNDEQFRLREMYASGKADNATEEKSFKRIEDLRRQMFETMTEARKQMNGVLTPEQRNRMHRGGPGWGW